MPRSDDMGGEEEEEDGEHQCRRILEISILTLSVSVSADQWMWWMCGKNQILLVGKSMCVVQ